MRLDYLSATAFPDAVARVLAHLGDAVRETNQFIIEAQGIRMSAEHFDAIVDDETELIETLAGAAFVVCQTHITAVVTNAIGILDSLRSDAPQQPLPLKPDKHALLSSGSPLDSPSQLTRVQVIDAAANYFKHNDEWGPDWSSVRGISARTVANLVALGLNQGSTGNLRQVLQVLGITEYDQLQQLAYDVADWAGTIAQVLTTECVARGLM